MNPKHKRWADYVVSGKSNTEAYKLVYPNATLKTCQNKGGVLSKKGELIEYINSRLQKIAEKVEKKASDELLNVEVGLILTSARKREILAKIVNGEMEVEKYVTVKGELKKVKAKPDLNDIMKAIELDNKMAGDNVQAKPNQVAKAEEVTKVVVVEDETESPKK